MTKDDESYDAHIHVTLDIKKNTNKTLPLLPSFFNFLNLEVPEIALSKTDVYLLINLFINCYIKQLCVCEFVPYGLLNSWVDFFFFF